MEESCSRSPSAPALAPTTPLPLNRPLPLALTLALPLEPFLETLALFNKLPRRRCCSLLDELVSILSSTLLACDAKAANFLYDENQFTSSARMSNACSRAQPGRSILSTASFFRLTFLAALLALVKLVIR